MTRSSWKMIKKTSSSSTDGDVYIQYWFCIALSYFILIESSLFHKTRKAHILTDGVFGIYFVCVCVYNMNGKKVLCNFSERKRNFLKKLSEWWEKNVHFLLGFAFPSAVQTFMLRWVCVAVTVVSVAASAVVVVISITIIVMSLAISDSIVIHTLAHALARIHSSVRHCLV